MNKNKLNKVKKDIKIVLDKKKFRIEKYMGEYGEITQSILSISTANSNMINAYLYSIIEIEDDQITLKVDINYMFNEAKIHPKFNSDQIFKIMELINLINRQAIICCFYVDSAEKLICLKKDIYLVNVRLNKVELEKSIDEIINYAGFYYPLIMESINSNEPLNKVSKMQWVCSSYFHKECRADIQD